MRLKTRHIFTALLAALLAAVTGCVREGSAVEEEGGTGDIILNICTAPETASTKSSGTRTPKEGNVMNLLSIWIVNRETGEILVHEHLLAKGDSSSGEDGASAHVGYVDFAEDGKSCVMRFNDIERGNCTLYAVANFRELDEGTYVVGAKIDDAFRDMLLHETVSDGKAPSFDDENGMPCSAVVDFSIGAGENVVSAEMLRCMGRLTIAVRNNIEDSAIYVKEMGLSKQNPTNGYVFEHEGGAIPSESKDVSFPKMQSIVRVPALTTDPVQVYDTYLYETSPESATNFTFSFFGAVYKADTDPSEVKIAYRQEYVFAENDSAGATVDDMFVLRNAASGNYYLGDADGALTYRFFSGDTELRHHKGIENYFWKFTGTSASTITNVGTGRQIKLSGETATMVSSGQGTTFTLISNDSIAGTGRATGLRFRAPDGYSLALGADLGVYGTNSRNNELVTHWIFRKASKGAAESIPYFDGADYEIPRVDRTMTYIDRYGVAQELNHINRNEHVYLTIGVFFNREIAQFEFEVEKWREKDSETTFD